MKKAFVLCLVIGMAVVAGAVWAADAAKEKGLVAYWSFDEGKGEVAKDSSGGNLEAVISGASWNKGKSGSALGFDGEEAYVEVEDNEAINPESEMTVEAWINAEDPAFPDWPGRQIVSKYGGNWQGYSLTLSSPGLPAFTLASTNPENLFYTASSKELIKANKWYLLTGVWDGKKIYIYVNGVLKGSADAPYLTNDSVALRIGCRAWSGGGNHFMGLIDEVKIYNRALSADEIKAHYSPAETK